MRRALKSGRSTFCLLKCSDYRFTIYTFLTSANNYQLIIGCIFGFFFKAAVLVKKAQMQ